MKLNDSEWRELTKIVATHMMMKIWNDLDDAERKLLANEPAHYRHTEQDLRSQAAELEGIASYIALGILEGLENRFPSG